MRKKILAMLLAMVLVLSLLPGTVWAAETVESDLPDWNFLFAIFKNVDADCADGNGAIMHTTYTMTQDEVNLAQDRARQFEAYMNSVGVMNAHVDVVEIDTPVTELADSGAESEWGAWVSPEQAAPILEDNGVDLDQYDHVTCVVNLNVTTVYLGIAAGYEFENGTGESCINFVYAPGDNPVFPESVYVHEFLHFMEMHISPKWGVEFDLHGIGDNIYAPTDDEWKVDYTDIILNRVDGSAGFGTGVAPFVWQYSPCTLRTMSELTIPDGVTAIRDYAFQNLTNLEKVTIPSSVTSIGDHAFYECGSLKSVGILSGVTSIGEWAFGNCSSLESVSIPASVTSIGYAAFWNTGVTDIYYGGTEAQWEAIQMDEFNSDLTNATIHYNSPDPEAEKPTEPDLPTKFTDIPAGKYYTSAVAWAVDGGIAKGTGGKKFSPAGTCTEAQILTMLWRAEEKPAAEASPLTVNSSYQAAVDWAYEQKIIDDDFDPNAACTRAKAVYYIWMVRGEETVTAKSFTDVKADAYYADAVSWAVANKITKGTGNKQFSPDEACERGMIVTFLYRAYNKSV